MLTQLRKQAWFVFLMAFVIGWSSAALASAKPMHQQMMSELSVHQGHSAGMQAMSNCHEAQTLQAHVKHDASQHVQMQLDQDCYNSAQDQTEHLSCNDCAQLYCQSLSTWLNVQTVELFDIEDTQQLQQLNFDYSAQHLSGFWQQILRPPKA
ncbi:hypothetical protein B9T25_11505 [Acinetobacter sp. ANC 4470]|uniref:hypothetical protein n=1 Tax=Acinetobacter sp. ANC 4470 TaxID=1977881 RepID=UPI000A33A176|nr:hypothetical protein [Acinetobacter sp. ANC 4470]OTG65729.1 hypothetical protein B9T25_11505 [Acinetobacter sp. ANC 4470]